MSHVLGRRSLLRMAGLAGGAWAAHTALSHVRTARAAGPTDNIFIWAYMQGGWDQLSALDPRPNNRPEYQRPAATSATGTGILPAYELIEDPEVRALLTANPSGVQTRGALTFGPAIPPDLLAHAPDLAIIRGIAMDTVAHQVGYRYVQTGKFPRGTSANGSSLTSLVAAAGGGTVLLPNMAIATESYAEGLPTFASGVHIDSVSSLQNILRPLGTPLEDPAAGALDQFRSLGANCDERTLDADKIAANMREYGAKAKSLALSGAADHFRFTLDGTAPPTVQALLRDFGITTAADLNGPKGRSAVAAQALARGLTTAVSVTLATGLDDHYDWGQNHVTELRRGFQALADLITFLKATPAASGGSLWSKTTLVVTSEFARTPMLNARDGRDHHIASSALVAGRGIAGNKVFGATSEVKMAAEPVDPATGRAKPNGIKLRPADVMATVMQSMGLDPAPLGNQTPVILRPLLKST